MLPRVMVETLKGGPAPAEQGREHGPPAVGKAGSKLGKAGSKQAKGALTATLGAQKNLHGARAPL